jgi:hypothetical protein
MNISKIIFALSAVFISCISNNIANSDKLKVFSREAIMILQKKVKFHGSKDFMEYMKTIKRMDRKEVCPKN